MIEKEEKMKHYQVWTKDGDYWEEFKTLKEAREYARTLKGKEVMIDMFVNGDYFKSY